jgi:deoxyribonuclease V
MMKVALDVAYQNEIAVVGIVQFADWDSAEPSETRSLVCKNPSEYIPGMFYLRELPCLLKALTTIERDYDSVVIDGYVHLAGL